MPAGVAGSLGLACCCQWQQFAGDALDQALEDCRSQGTVPCGPFRLDGALQVPNVR